MREEIFTVQIARLGIPSFWLDSVQKKIKETKSGKLDSFISDLTELSPEEQNKYGESCGLGSLEVVAETHCLVPEVY